MSFVIIVITHTHTHLEKKVCGDGDWYSKRRESPKVDLAIRCAICDYVIGLVELEKESKCITRLSFFVNVYLNWETVCRSSAEMWVNLFIYLITFSTWTGWCTFTFHATLSEVLITLKFEIFNL